MNPSLRRLREKCDALNPPATANDIRLVEALFGEQLPASLVEIYTDHGGMRENSSLPLRLMAPKEVLEVHDGLVVRGVVEIAPHSGLFWTEDGPFFAGLFLSGELQGYVYLLDAGAPDCTPVFRSIDSFYKRLLAFDGDDKFDFWNITADLPCSIEPTSIVQSEVELEIAQRHLAAFLTDPVSVDAERNAFNACSLMPYDHLNEILPLLESQNMWVQERVARVLGKHRYDPAAPQLYNVALSGTHNGRLASILALKEIDTGETRQMLSKLRQTLDPGWDVYFR